MTENAKQQALANPGTFESKTGKPDGCWTKPLIFNKGDLMGFIYKGYLLRSRSVHLAEGDRWTMEVAVAPNRGAEAESREQVFSSENTFSTKAMADMEGIIFGRKIIDGEIRDLALKEED